MKLVDRMKSGEKIAIGMVHSLPLPSAFRFGGDMDEIFRCAVQDAVTLEKAGFDAITIENTCDAPTGEKMTVGQIAGLSAVAARVRQAVKIPIGVEAVFNDYEAALAIAIVAQAEYIRLPVFVDTVISGAGVIPPCSREAVLMRKALGAENVSIFADVHSKHTHLLNPEISIEESAIWAKSRGADAVIVTGQATGMPTSVDTMASVKRVVNIPVLAGSGVNAQNVADQFSAADGVIVGSSMKKNGNLLARIEPDLAEQLMDAIRSAR